MLSIHIMINLTTLFIVYCNFFIKSPAGGVVFFYSRLKKRKTYLRRFKRHAVDGAIYRVMGDDVMNNYHIQPSILFTSALYLSLIDMVK